MIRSGGQYFDNLTIVIGVANVWTARKGLRDFIRLAGKVDDTTVILLVGLKKQQQQNLPRNIIGIERTESARELARLYSAADLFLNLTYEDNYPTTNLEAMACGTPVLTYRTGGSIESVDESTGFVVEQGDLDSVVRIIKQVKKSDYMHESLCKAQQSFNKDTCFAQYINLYDSLL